MNATPSSNPPALPVTSGAVSGVSGIPGFPRSHAECDALTARLADIEHRLRDQVRRGLPQETFAQARTVLAALDAARAFVASIRQTLGPDGTPMTSAANK